MTLGRHVSACATILACVTLGRALLYSNLIMYFRFPRASMRCYTVHALLFEFCQIMNLSMEVPKVYIAIWSFVEF